MPTLVVPCFNEANRLRCGAIGELVARHGLRVLLVNDGSTDATLNVLVGLEKDLGPRAQVLNLPRNVGKGEAVRAGLLSALAQGESVVGYADADFATPSHELFRLLDVLVSGPHQVVLGSRVARLGATVSRSPFRHGVGRVFATAAALAVGTQVYDTQCGAKWFKRSPVLEQALSLPFASRWAFDVELLMRLLGRVGRPDVPTAACPLEVSDLLEVPLESWRHVDGSTLRPIAMAGAFLDVVRLAVSARRRQVL